MIDLLFDLPVAAEHHEILRRDQHDPGRPQLHRGRIFPTLHLDLAAQRAITAGLPVDGIQLVIAVCEHVERRSLDCMVQQVPVGSVIVGVERLPAFDRILELGFARREIDDIDFGVGGWIRTRDVQESGRRQLGVIELSFDFRVLLQAQRRGGDIQDVHESA